MCNAEKDALVSYTDLWCFGTFRVNIWTSSGSCDQVDLRQGWGLETMVLVSRPVPKICGLGLGLGFGLELRLDLGLGLEFCGLAVGVRAGLMTRGVLGKVKPFPSSIRLISSLFFPPSLSSSLSLSVLLSLPLCPPLSFISLCFHPPPLPFHPLPSPTSS